MKDSITPTKNKLSPVGLRWTASIFWLAVWVVAFFAVGEPLLLPSPWAVVWSLARQIVTIDFWIITAGSLLRILAGFLLGLIMGVLLAAVSSAYPTIRAAVALPMNIIKATPIASFVILALLFIRGHGFSTFIAFLIVVPLAWSNVLQGIESTDRNLLEMAQVYRFSRWDTMRYIYIPSAFPYLLSAARVGMGFAWKSGIAGEVIAIPTGAIGTQLYNAKVSLSTADLFAWTVVIILLSMLLEGVALELLGRISPTPRVKGGHRL